MNILKSLKSTSNFLEGPRLLPVAQLAERLTVEGCRMYVLVINRSLVRFQSGRFYHFYTSSHIMLLLVIIGIHYIGFIAAMHIASESEKECNSTALAR